MGIQWVSSGYPAVSFPPSPSHPSHQTCQCTAQWPQGCLAKDGVGPTEGSIIKPLDLPTAPPSKQWPPRIMTCFFASGIYTNVKIAHLLLGRGGRSNISQENEKFRKIIVFKSALLGWEDVSSRDNMFVFCWPKKCWYFLLICCARKQGSP